MRSIALLLLFTAVLIAPISPALFRVFEGVPPGYEPGTRAGHEGRVEILSIEIELIDEALEESRRAP